MAGGGGMVAGLSVERGGAVATVVLDRPDKRNALSLAMWEGLPGILADLDADPAVQAIILTGRGQEAFSAGADIGEFAAIFSDGATTARFERAVRAANHALTACAKPVVALVRGLCVGGGCGLALHCDLRFAAQDARFAITPAKLGFVYPYADTARLVAQIGPSRAKDMLMSARLIDADEALAIGLVDRVWPTAEVEAATRAYLAALDGLSQYTIRASKRVVEAVLAALPAPGDEASAAYLAGVAGSPDFIEGRTAFLAGRRPRFRWGRPPGDDAAD